jgi:hypothetical protein
MKHNLVILMSCLWVMPLHAQPQKMVGTTWANGAEAYGCKWVDDSVIQLYCAGKHCEGISINILIRPDGELSITDKDIPPTKHPKLNMGNVGEKVVYKEIGGLRFLLFYSLDNQQIWEALEALKEGESVNEQESRYKTLYGLAGTYLDSATHRKIVFQPDTPIVTGLTNSTHYRFGTSIYNLMQPLMIFDNGQVLYYEPNPKNWIDEIDILSAPNFVGPPDSCWWDRGERIMTLRKIGPANVSDKTDLPGRYSFASTRLMTWAILTNFSTEQRRLIRNEIFARYGYRFKSPDLIAYFSAQPWYIPRYDDVSAKLTDLERINVALLNPE